MVKFKKTWLSRALCGALAVALVSGTAIMSPVADFVGTNIIASAATYTGNVDASQLKNGDILKAGACVQGWLTVYDENNNMIVNEEDHWSVYESDGKDYTINSITYDDFVGAYTIHVTSATVVSNAKELLTALAAGGEIKLANDISINQTVTISKACTIDFNGKKITFGGARNDKYHLEVNAPTTLKNGTLTSSCTNDPRFFVLNVSSNTVVENMTISQPGNGGGHGIVYIGGSNVRFTMKDSTITYVQNGKYTARGIQAENNATLLFYGENFINTTNSSSGWYDWNIIENCDCYFYPGTLEVNYHFAAYSSSSKVYFCGGAVKNTRSGDTVFSGLSADKVILQNDGDDYEIYSDEDCTVSMTADQAVSASAIYSKLVAAYTVTWQNDDGTVLETDTNVSYGTTPTYDGETPTKDGCIFTGWKDDNGTFYANGTVLPNVTADTTYTAVFEKELAVGTKYYIGDKFSTNGSKYIIPDNRYSSTYSLNNSAVVPTPTYRKAENYWYFDNIIRSGWGFTMADNAFSGTETVKGFRCVSGDGSSSNAAFKFDLIYENETDTCEMDFSDVETSIVSIKDADENTVALNNGKATIKTGYVITSAKPLSFPKTYTVQQSDESNFVYVIKNMIQSDKQVSYDTSAFKGKVTSYIGRGVTIEGYEGTSAQLVKKGAYYGKSVSMDLSHGTRLIGQNDYYDAPLDEFFDIYNSDGKNITDLFEFSNMAGGSANYYYYKLKQNLEDDITVFPVGTKFTLTLPEGVEIANKDVIVSQEGNVYTIKPTANVTLLSDNLLNIYNGGTLLVADIKYSAVKNHQFVYEVNVTNQINAEISTASIIRTQEELANAKTGDYVMPTETLNINEAGYGWCDVSKYLHASDGYYAIGSGTSLGNYTTATIGNDLIIYLNGSARYVPANPDLCTSSGRYDIETYKGNAWRVNFVGTEYNYHAIELTSANYVEPSEYEFTWADDKKSATVTFNNEEPVDAVVELTPDYENKQFLCTATKEYNGIPYIETTTVSFPNLADVADVAVDDIVINQDMPTVTVTDTATNTVLELDKDYTVEYSGDTTNAGTATVTITAKDGSTYIGSKSVKFAVLPREMKASITNRRKIGNNAKVVLSSEWYLPKNATNIKAGIARLSTDDTNITKYDVYNNGVKKASALKTTSGKYSFSLLMNSTHANQNLYAVTYVTYEIDRVPYVSISKMSESLA